MTKHDEIVLQLTNEKLLKILKPIYEEKISKRNYWCDPFYGYLKNNKISDWLIEKIFDFNDGGLIRINPRFNDLLNHHSKSLKKMEDIPKFLLSLQLLMDKKDYEDIFVSKVTEYPLIKGHNQYQITKGYADLIVHLKSNSVHYFSSYSERNCVEFFIEVKTENDLNDIGAILRQINEYKTYYNAESVYNWRCKGCKFLDRSKIQTFYCLLIPKIDSIKRKFFEEQGIVVLELNDVDNEKKVGEKDWSIKGLDKSG